VLHSWDFFALLSPCCIPTVTRRLTPLAPSPFLLAARFASLHPPPRPCLAPPAAAPPSTFLVVVPRPRSVLRRPAFSLGFRARPNPVVWTERQGARAAAEGSAVRETGGLLSGGMPPLLKLHSRALRRRPLFPSSEVKVAAFQRRTATCASSFPGDRRRRSVAARPPGSRAGLRLRFPIAAVAASSSATGARLRLAHPRRRGRQQPGVCATACATTAGAPPLLQHMTRLSPFFIEPFAA
jgi:hypothetical protein